MARDTTNDRSFPLFHASVLLVLSVTFVYGWHSLSSTNDYLSSHDVSASTKMIISKPSHNSSSSRTTSGLRYCTSPCVPQNNHHTNNTTTTTCTSNTSLPLLYQCRGRAYNAFAEELHQLADRTSTHHSWWGRRPFPLPAQTHVLVIGNSHLRQVSKTLLCQYASQIQHIHWTSSEVFTVTFTNGGRWTSITNTVLVYSHQWDELLQEFFLPPDTSNHSHRHTQKTPFDTIDAIVLGKFTRYEQALGTNFEKTMAHEQEYYTQLLQEKKKQQQQKQQQQQQQQQRKSSLDSTADGRANIDFTTIPPPSLLDVAKKYPHHPMVSVSMFASSDIDRMVQSRMTYLQYISNKNISNNNNNNNNNNNSNNNNNNNHTDRTQPSHAPVRFVNSRRYIDKMHLECGSDDKLTLGDCRESGQTIHNSNRDPSNMHRCSGDQGGHADLISWDLVEELQELLV